MISNAAPAGAVSQPVFQGAGDAALMGTLRLLHSPLDWEPFAWRGEVTRSLRNLLGADAAVCLLWRQGHLEAFADELEPEVITEYMDRFAPLDLGMQRRDALGLGLWNRQLLWSRDVLLRSEYFNEFARPRAIHDTVGLSVELDEIPAHLRIVLIFRDGSPGPEASDERLARLQPILPALRTGLRIQLGFGDWLDHTSSLLDKVGERLMLLSLDGRELYRSATMRRTLQDDPCREQLVDALRAASRAVAAVAQPGRPVPIGTLRHLGAARQRVLGATGRYRVRACLIGPDTVGPDTVVLVTMDPVTTEAPPADLLQGRYGLTPREVQVAGLLVQRMTNREIALALGISAHTARHHTESVLLKTHVNSRRALRQLLAGDR